MKTRNKKRKKKGALRKTCEILELQTEIIKGENCVGTFRSPTIENIFFVNAFIMTSIAEMIEGIK